LQQAFRCSAGFKKTQIQNQEKWLGRISVNSTLHAFNASLASSTSESPIEKTILLCDLMLETTSIDNKLLEHNLLKLASYTYLQQTLGIFDKALSKANKGGVTIQASTVRLIFEKELSLLDKWCENLFGSFNAPTKNPRSCWLLNISSQDMYLYQLVCEKLFEKYPSFLPEFVKTVQIERDIVPLYKCEEQPCVTLLLVNLPEGVDVSIRNVHVKKTTEELLRLWSISPGSVVKLISHFPVLVKWLTNYYEDDNVKRLCFYLIKVQ